MHSKCSTSKEKTRKFYFRIFTNGQYFLVRLLLLNGMARSNRLSLYTSALNDIGTLVKMRNVMS